MQLKVPGRMLEVKMQIYKLNDVYDNGKRIGELYAESNDADWWDEPEVMMLVKGNKAEIRNGHVEFDNCDEGVIFDKKMLNDFQGLTKIWQKIRFKYVYWQEWKYNQGFYYSKPFSENVEELPKGTKFKIKKQKKEETIEGLQKIREEYFNDELGREIFSIWNNFILEFTRDTIGIRKRGRGLILFDHEVSKFNQFVKILDKQWNC
jgi:hypothetical protein